MSQHCRGLFIIVQKKDKIREKIIIELHRIGVLYRHQQR
jgi:hypothetical protein